MQKLASLQENKHLKVGIFDADLYGPSLPTLIDTQSSQVIQEEDTKMLKPIISNNDLKLMSLGWLKDSISKASIMRESNVIKYVLSNINTN